MNNKVIIHLLYEEIFTCKYEAFRIYHFRIGLLDLVSLGMNE